MMLPLRRAACLALILSLIASLAPQDAYAQLARGANAGAARGLPASGLPGVSAGAPSAVSLSLSAPSLAGSLSVPQDAPRLSPALLAPALTPAAAALPAASEAPSAPRSSEGPSAAAAPAADAGSAESAGKNASLMGVPEHHTALGVLKSLLGRAGAVPHANVAPESGLSGRVFDGSASKAASADTVAARQGRAASWALSRFEKSIARRQRDSDDFGGPKSLGPTTRLQKIGYGAKWGVNMVGIAALYNLLLAPLIAAVPWPAFLGDASLEGVGRVALLISAGPQEIVAGLSLAPATFLGLPVIAAAAALLAAKPLARALTARGPLAKAERPVKALAYAAAGAFAVFAFLSAPGSFLGMSLPVMAAFEEVSFRVLSFLPTFALLALTRPVLNWAADHLDAVPNHAGVRGGFQAVLRLLGGTVAWFAYPIAATLAAMAFAAAHFASWGVDPFVYITQFTMAMMLTRVAYRSESLSAPITAHLTFNLLTLGGLSLAAVGFTGLASTYSILLSVLGVVALLYNYLSHRRDQAASKKGLFPGSRMLSVLALAGLIGAGAFHGGVNEQSLVRAGADRPSIVLAQELAPERAGVPAAQPALPADAGAGAPAAAPAPVESRADVIARVSPSVFKVIVGKGLGTGFILTPQGLAASNAHVIGATPVGGFVMVEVEGAPRLRAKVLAVNHDRDIALLALPRHPSGAWRSLTLSPTAPRPGDETLAIGFPLGLDKTVTHGIVSGVGRHHNQYVAHIQTDAAINPGNSGGPLFNERGEVIGMNTFIVTRTGTSIGLGFAIMGPDLARTLAQFALTQDISSGRLGIIANLSDPLKPEAGLQIEYVRPGSGAERAGLQRGDLILRIGDTLLVQHDGEGAARGIAAALAQTIPGQKLSVTVLRGEQRVTVEVVIDAKPSYP